MEDSMQDGYDTKNNGSDTSNPDNGYFAAGTAENLAGVCLNKSQSFFNLLRANFYLEKLARMWSFYHGEYANNYVGGSHKIDFTGQQGELVNLPVNHFRNIAQHMLVMITANRPSMEAMAINTDSKSLAQTYLANGILHYYMRQKHLEDVIHKATEMAIVLGAGYVRMEWNATAGELYDFDPETNEPNYEGELEFTNLSPFDITFDGTKESWNNDWIIVRTFKNKYDLMAKFPEHEEKIKQIPSKDQSTVYRLAMFSNDMTDDIPVYEFYHKRTESLPNGRYTLFLDQEIILLDMPLPYKEIPVYRITAGEFLGTPYGYTPMFDIYPIQESINALYSTIMSNQNAFGVQNLFVPRGSDIEINSLEGALNIIEGNAKPEPLQMLSTPPEVFNFLNMLIQSAETVSGVNSVARGNPEASLKSGTALALVQSMALQFISGLQDNYVKLIEQLGTSLINIIKDYAKTPKTISIVGKNNKSKLKEFVGDDINDINRVMVSVGNPLAQTTAGRVQMAEQLIQMGLITDTQQYFQVLNTGNIESMYEGNMDELLLIKEENENLMEGKEVLAEITDNHKQHIMEHRSVMANPDLRRDPKLRAIVQQHLQEHINMLKTVDPDLLMLMGQQPLAPPPPPPGMGPPPGAGGLPPMGGMPPQGGGMPPMGGAMPPPGAGGPPPGMPPAGMGMKGRKSVKKLKPPKINKRFAHRIDKVLTLKSGLPQADEMLQGQGVAGGQLIPQVPKPAGRFKHLPVLAKNKLPQG